MQPDKCTNFRAARSRDVFSRDKVEPSERRNSRADTGFSLLELLVVMAIMLIVAAFAVPSMRTTIDGYRIRGTATSVTGLVQRCRVQAIRQDLSQRIHFATVSGRVVLFVTTATDTATKPNPTDAGLSAQYWLPNQFSIVPGQAPSGPGAPKTLLDSNTMWGTSVTVTNINVDPYFNSRGMPCLPDAVTGVCNTTTGFIYYYRYQSSKKTTRWAATSISPVGRIQSWFWNGSSWGN